MINTIDDLERHLASVALRFPRMADRLTLVSPGCSASDLERLALELPDLPSSYLEVLARFDLTSVSVGAFELSPPGARQQGLVAAIINANGADVRFDEASDLGLLTVASAEQDLICVEDNNSTNPGAVWRIDLGYGPEPIASRLASGFERLMIGAGRLHEILLDSDDAGASEVEDFLEQMAALGCDGEELANWRFFAETSLLGA